MNAPGYLFLAVAAAVAILVPWAAPAAWKAEARVVSLGILVGVLVVSAIRL